MPLSAPQRYQDLPGDANRVYGSLCKVISGRRGQVEWVAFSPQDWDLLGEMAQQEYIGPLLYGHFKDDSWPEGIPVQVAAQLMQQYFDSRENNQSLYQKLDQLVALFQQAQIPVILLKGIVFAKTLYPDVALRPMLDIDLLVHKKDLGEAVKVLKANGFVEHYRDFQPGLSENVEHHYHLESDNAISLELHWSLISGDKDWRTPSESWIWSNREEAAILEREDLRAWELTPSATLLYLSAHMALQHGLAFTRLIWFFDVHELLRKYAHTLDWETLINSAQTLGWAAALHAVLMESQARLGTSIPGVVLEKLQTIESHDAGLVRRKTVLDLQYEQMAAELATLDWASRGKVILARLFPSPAYIRYHHQPHPGWLLPLYYPYRWLVIATRVVQMLLKRIL